MQSQIGTRKGRIIKKEKENKKEPGSSGKRGIPIRNLAPYPIPITPASHHLPRLNLLFSHASLSLSLSPTLSPRIPSINTDPLAQKEKKDPIQAEPSLEPKRILRS